MDLYPLTLDYQLAKNRARFWQILQGRKPSYEAYRKDTQRILNHILQSIRLVYEMPPEKRDFSDFSDYSNDLLSRL